MVLEKTLESPLGCKEIKPVHPKGNQPWIFTGRTDAEAEAPVLWPPDAEMTHWIRPWCWERLKAGEGDNRGWDGWTASLTQWTWVWASFRSWWWTERPGVVHSMGLQRVGHKWTTESQSSQVAQPCPTLGDPMDYSPPGSSVCGIFQARVLEWGAIAFSMNNWTELIMYSVSLWM